MNKVIFRILIIISFLFLLLIIYLGVTEVIINPKLIERELYINEI